MTTTAAATDSAERGRSARADVPRSAHRDWEPTAGRADPVDILTRQDADRLPWLVPVRHSRMAESSFAFYRGAAAIMAADLAGTPSMGESVQLCGDAHLSNFGTFASPERRQVFDVNDFDETLPGPWEWDLKRLAVSMVLAARDNGYRDSGSQAAREAVAAYREAMAHFASADMLDVWYAQLSLDRIQREYRSKADRKRVAAGAARARGRNAERALGKLTETVDGKRRIKPEPPLLIPLREITHSADREALGEQIRSSFSRYLETLLPDRRELLRRFEVVDMALKVVGVGSVGTRCFLVLLAGRERGEPLFLQIKEATRSVLADHLPVSPSDEHGRRVVTGQRLMQASTDVFLGWSQPEGGHHYYWRQFHDMKGSADVAAMNPVGLANYGGFCGWTLAHAHARSGNATAISAYLGTGRAMDRAVAGFAEAYAEQNERDYEAFTQAIADGRIEASPT
jgi:uncharacterized protein (DUF2252 family)